MKTIEVTDEMYNSLMELSKEMTSQDMRCTQMPHMFQIQTDEEIQVPEGEGKEKFLYAGEILDKEDLTSLWKEVQDDYDGYQEFIDHNHIIDIYTDIVKKYQNTFLTARACQKHIDANDYHYNKPVVYLNHAWRNPEMELVSKFLCELSKGELHK